MRPDDAPRQDSTSNGTSGGSALPPERRTDLPPSGALALGVGANRRVGRPVFPRPEAPAEAPAPQGRRPWAEAREPFEGSGENPGPFSTLVSLHYLMSAVRRWRRRVVALALLGSLLGAAFLLFAPTSHVARTALVLRHGAGDDPARAMETDVTLAGTRTIAVLALKKLNSTMRPEDLQKALLVSPPKSDVLEMTMSGPTDDEALRRMTAFAQAYLEFRSQQVSVESQQMIDGYTGRIKELQAQLDKQQATLDTLGGKNSTTGALSSDYADALAKKTRLSNQLEGLQDQLSQTQLQQTAVRESSRIIDPPAIEPGNTKTRVALALISGLIGGLAIGLAAAVFQALLSDRLRLRVEFATALEAPVLASVGGIAPPGLLTRTLRFLPGIRGAHARRVAAQRRAAWAVRMALPESPSRLIVACVDNAEELRFAVAAAGITLQRGQRHVQLVDLTEEGGLEDAVRRLTAKGTEERPTVLRPAVVPTAAVAPSEFDLAGSLGGADLSAVGDGCVIVLADLNPAVGADHLAAWAHDIVVGVTSGRSKVERVRTAHDLIRSAGLVLRGVLLLHTERLDQSSGVRPEPATRPGRAVALRPSVESAAVRAGQS